MDWFVIALRILHIGGGIFWVGAAFTFFFFVEPSTRVLAPAALNGFMGEVMGRRRFPIVVLVASLITVLAGGILYWRVWDGFDFASMSPSAIGFGIGGLAALFSFFIGLLVIVPTIKRLGDTGAAMMAAGRPPSDDEQATLHGLESRLATAGRLDLVGLSVAVLFMAISRYLG